MLALPAAAWAVAQPRAVRAHLVSLSDFREISRDVFASVELAGDEQRAFEARLRGAQARVRDLFGSYSARPTIIIAADEESARQFSPNLHAAIHASPFGAFVVLGPEGLPSLDVLAHELSHAEHLARVGYLKWIATPAWFIEGVGMLADQRPKYSEDALMKADPSKEGLARIRELSSFEQFARGDLRLNYASAKVEVHRIWLRLGPAGLAAFLESQRLWRGFVDQLDQALDQDLAR